MKTATVLEHFNNNTHAVAAALDISRQAVEKWGPIVPWGSARWLEIYTKGKLKVDLSLYRKARRAT